MESNPNRLKKGLTSGITKGWSGFVWMLQIIIPISFLTVLLSYSGWMDRIDFLLQPVMTLLLRFLFSSPTTSSRRELFRPNPVFTR
jgi:Fe2+ transport system protein B